LTGDSLDIFWLIVSFVFGLAIGSFLNVTIYRIPRRISLFFPGSHCPGCDAPIRWYDNIPVLSYLILQGKCRRCGAEISSRYPLVELLTGSLFALLYFTYFVVESGRPLGVFAIHLVLVSALISASFIDIDRQIIPDRITLGGIFLGPVVSLLYPALHEPVFFKSPHFGSLAASLLGMIAGGGFIFIVGLLGKLAFKKEAMGFGDVKLMGMVGALLGWQNVLFANLAAPVFGCIVGIPMLLKSRQKFKRIPYGPYLAAASVTALLFGDRLIGWYLGALVS